MKFLLTTGSLVLALCAGFASLSYSTSPASPGINIAALDTKFGLLEVREKRPWLNPARAALKA